MAGYTRQSIADIIPTATVRAAPLNAEYNAIRDAFSASGGHKHDGTAAEGDYVPLISDLDNYNKVVIDSTNNRVGVFVEVSAAAVEQVRFQDGAIVPVTTNDIDLGTSLLKFKDLYLEGTATIGNISLDGGTIDDTVIGGTTPAAGTFTTMTATTVDINGGAIDGTTIGATTPAAADFTTMDASGNATVGGTFGVTGNTTIGGTLGVTGVTTLGTANITSVDLDSGAIDNTTIGAATPAAGTFTTLTANTSLTAATADINGGTIDGATIGATSHTTGKFTTLQSTGLATLASVDINGGAIDGTTIGASSAAAGSFTTVSTSGQATLATADINGGTIDGTTIGTTTPAAITGTTVTATSFVGPVTGAVTGNVTGNVTGDLTGDVTGNITSSGSSSFNNVTIDGTLNMNAGTTATITNLTSPTNTNDAATKGYVDTSISNLVDSAPGTLDTLNELAAALGDDPNFSTTITNSIATKLPLAGGTMTGAIAMSTNKITGLGDPTAAQDAMTKAYADATYLALSGGTMTGAIDMGSQKITTTYTPTNAADLTTKTYVDGILGSATAASASAAAAATSESNAATSETNAATSASNAATDRTTVQNIYDDFDDRYLGAKASAPTLDNDGDALVIGALYFNTTTNIMNVYSSGGWQSAGSAVNGTSDRQTYTATAGQTVFAATYDAGYVDVYLNGVKLLAGTDFTATNGTSITLASGAAVNDIVDIVAYGTFVLADHLTETQSDAKYVEVAGDTMTGNLGIGISPVTHNGNAKTLHVDGGANASELRLTNTTTGSASANGFHIAQVGNTSYVVQNENAPLNFYTNGAYAAQFDASGNFLVGKTGSAFGTEGVEVRSDGLWVTRDSDTPVFFNRETTDGQILNFSKDTSTVGSIGTIGGDVYFTSTGANAGLRSYDAANALSPVTNTGGLSDGNVNLGWTDSRFKDLYLSSSVQIHDAGGQQGRFSVFDDSTFLMSATDLQIRTGGLNAGDEAARIDASGNLLVGHTSTYSPINNGGDGVTLSANGEIFAGSSQSSGVMLLNRENSDGNIIAFRKDGADKGGVFTSDNGTLFFGWDTSGDKTVGYGVGDTGIKINDSIDAVYPAFAITGANRDAAIDIGRSTVRFADGYFGGSLNLDPSTNGNAQINLGDPSQTQGGPHGIKFYTQNGASGDHAALQFRTGDNTINFENTAAQQSIKLYPFTGQAVFNNTNNNTGDFQVKSANNNHSLFVDAGTGDLKIGHNNSLNPHQMTSGNAMTFRSDIGLFSLARETYENIILNRTGSTNGDVAVFRRNATPVGSISVSNSGTTYNTTSDRRLKDNIEPIADGTEKLMAMKPVTHTWKANPNTGETVHGFIAQEMQEIVPEAVSGDPDGEEMMSMDYGRITPVLVAALQDAHKKIEALEERLAELEAK